MNKTILTSVRTAETSVEFVPARFAGRPSVRVYSTKVGRPLLGVFCEEDFEYSENESSIHDVCRELFGEEFTEENFILVVSTIQGVLDTISKV